MVEFKMPEDVYRQIMAMRSQLPYRVLMWLVTHHYSPPVTRAEMAADIGASTRAVGRALKRLQEAGVITGVHRAVVHRFDLSLEIPRPAPPPDVTQLVSVIETLKQQISALQTRVENTEGQFDGILCDTEYDVDAAYQRGVEAGRLEALEWVQCEPPSGDGSGTGEIPSGGTGITASSTAAVDGQDNGTNEATEDAEQSQDKQDTCTSASTSAAKTTSLISLNQDQKTESKDVIHAFERTFGVRVPADAVVMTGAMVKMTSLQTARKLKEIKNPIAYLRKIHASMPAQERQAVSCPVSVPVVQPVRSANLPPMVDMEKVQAAEIANREWHTLSDDQRSAYIERMRPKAEAMPGKFTVPLQLLGKNLFMREHRFASILMR